MFRSGAAMKPELVLKRANDLINSAIGNNADKEKRIALEQIHNVISIRKKGVWNKSYEVLMKKHLELCVDLKDHHTAKDGLHQYRNLCQTVDPNSLEVIILYLMELSEDRATAARLKANQVALSAAAKIADLDQEESPESIMLSTMTEEVAKDRTDREVVVPWLRFLWENYRAVLELLYRIPKLERTYHKTCEKAFKFCQEYTRVSEFRRLCEMLRTQLTSLQKVLAPSSLRNRTQWEWTPEAVELHLQTRFAQLEVATNLELWNEGFRTVQDIYEIMVAGKKTPKAKLMVNYYEKLTRIFWVAENELFHAYAWFKYYMLCSDSKKELKSEDKAVLASNVLLAALTIPAMRDVYAQDVDNEEIVDDRSQHMALILDFQSNPSRTSLLADIVSKGLLNDVLPELATLYENLEVKFQPLNIVKRVSSAVAAINAHPTLAQYARPLQRIIVIKLMQQLSRVYTTVKLDFVRKLLNGLDKSFLSNHNIEKILVKAVLDQQLKIKINHSEGFIQFDNSETKSASISTKSAKLGIALSSIANTATLEMTTKEVEAENSSARTVFLQKVAASVEDEYARCMNRKDLIERRKEKFERVQQEKERAEQIRAEQEEFYRREAEKARLREEELQREEEKRRKDKEKLDIIQVQRELEKYGVIMDINDITELEVSARNTLILEAKTEAHKAKEEENKKLVEQAKRMDYISRALRIEGATAIKKRYAEMVAEDRAEYERSLIDIEAKVREQFEKDKKEKLRLSKMQPFRQHFQGDWVEKQHKEYLKQSEFNRTRMIKEKRDRKVAEARRLFDEEMERIEEEERLELERQMKEEQARLEQEQFETMRRKREADAEAEKMREAELAKIQRMIEEAEREKNLANERLEEVANAAPKPAAYQPARGLPPVSKAPGGERFNRRDDEEEKPADADSNWRGMSRSTPNEEQHPAAKSGVYRPPVDRAERGGFEKSERGGFDKFDRSERSGFDKSERSERGGFEKSGRPERGGFDKFDRSERGGFDKSSRPERGGFDKSSRPERGGFDKSERPERGGFDKFDRSERGGFDKSSRPERGGFDKSERPERGGFDKSERSERGGFDKFDRSKPSDRSEKPREDKWGRSDKDKEGGDNWGSRGGGAPAPPANSRATNKW